MLFVLALAEFGEGTMSPERLGDLIDRYGQTVLRTAYFYLKDKQKAEDICQEVFLKLFREDRAFESNDHEKAFILRMTINLCKDQLKSFWFKRIVLDDSKEPGRVEDIAEQVADKEARKALFSRVMALPEAFKTVIILYYYEGLSTREIAELLSIPDATVRSRLKRARERLGKELKGGVSHA